MATYYMDLVNGDDVNDGLSFAKRWKTFASGATAARIAPGDVIRIMQSPPPTSLGQNVTWTKGSRTLTLTTAVTANITLCETAWTPSADVSASTNGFRKEGNLAVEFNFGGGFTTGKAAYFDLGVATDFSAYEQISFWVYTNTAFTAGAFTLTLCSDATGDVPVDTFNIPEVGSSFVGRYINFTIDNGGPLGAAIRSIALNATTDPGTTQILFDNILAIKAPTDADSLSLISLIGKNNGTADWYPIQSINGTTIILDVTCNTQASATTAGRYGGTTEAVTTYKRETIKQGMTTGNANPVQDSGTAGNLITFIGGWNESDMTSRVDYTWIDGEAQAGVGFLDNGNSYVRLDYLCACSYGQGFASTGQGSQIDHATVCGCGDSGAIVFNGNYQIHGELITVNNNCPGVRTFFGNACYIDSIPFTCGNNGDGLAILSDYSMTVGSVGECNYNFGGNGIQFNNTARNVIKGITNIIGNSNNGILFVQPTTNCIIYDAGTVSDNAIYALDCGINTTGNRIYGGTLGTGNGGGIQITAGDVYFCNVAITNVAFRTNFSSNARIYSVCEGGDTEANFIYGAYVQSTTAVRHALTGIAWQISPIDATFFHQYNTAWVSLARFSCEDATAYTVKVWARRTNTGIEGRMLCRGSQIAGVATDVTDSITVGADTWEELSISFTPTQNGLVEILGEAWGGSTFSVYFDDLSVNDIPVTMDYTHLLYGPGPDPLVAAGGGGGCSYY